MNTANTQTECLTAEWNTINWRKLEIKVFKLQKRIYQATQRGDRAVVRRLQKTLMKSWSARMLAVRKVTQENKGKKTAGIDGIKSIETKQRVQLARELKVFKKPKPTRRVWIPKPGKTEKRPLGIPVMYDRALQALAKMALEPEWEAFFEPNSFGFRPGKSAHDAIQAIFQLVCHKPKWVLDADISSCFDKINHKHLLQKLQTYPTMRKLIKSWLKSGVMDNGVFERTDSGTPQGGVISPLLANIALHGLETYLENLRLRKVITSCDSKTKQPKLLQIIRYADDFVVFHEDKAGIEYAKKHIEDWLSEVGLELKSSKTRIAHTLEGENGKKDTGFDFLGFHIQQYPKGKHQTKRGWIPLITPSKASVKKLYTKIAGIIDESKQAKQSNLIDRLNPILIGWANYFKTVVSKEIFTEIDNLIWNKLRRWCYRRHPMKSKSWVINKYWGIDKGLGWVFTNGDKQLRRLGKVPIERHTPVFRNKSPFDGDFIYWSQRLSEYPLLTEQKKKLLKFQDGKCAHCGVRLTMTDKLEVHHKIPRCEGGKSNYDNLILIHLHCHDQLHSTHVKRSIKEEPGKVKVLSPVLKTSQRGDSLA